MGHVLIRFQFSDPNPALLADVHESLRSLYGGGLNYVAEGTILLDTQEDATSVFNSISRMFSFDDKLFVADITNHQSMHSVSRSRPAIRMVS